jgi:hypothetical protein
MVLANFAAKIAAQFNKIWHMVTLINYISELFYFYKVTYTLIFSIFFSINDGRIRWRKPCPTDRTLQFKRQPVQQTAGVEFVVARRQVKRAVYV